MTARIFMIGIGIYVLGGVLFGVFTVWLRRTLESHDRYIIKRGDSIVVLNALIWPAVVFAIIMSREIWGKSAELMTLIIRDVKEGGDK